MKHSFEKTILLFSILFLISGAFAFVGTNGSLKVEFIQDSGIGFHNAIDNNIKLSFVSNDFATGEWTDGNYVFNVGVYFKQDLPTGKIVYPNGNEVFDTASTSFINVIFTLKDAEYNQALIDMNYSIVDLSGTGSPILFNESLNSFNILCDSADFSVDTNCTFRWNIWNVPDGNYFLLLFVNDGELTASDSSDYQFTILTSLQPDQNYNKRFIQEQSAQKDSKRYINPASTQLDTNDGRYITSLLTLTPEQKDSASQSETLKYVIGILIIVVAVIIVVFVWKPKK